MPTTRKTTAAKKPAAKPRVKKRDEEDLLEFEQFVSQNPKSGINNKGLIFSTLLVVVIILAAISIFSLRTTKTVVKGEPTFKAVSLDNGLIYYAKVMKEDSMNVYLDDVYYIQTQQQTIPAEEEGGEPQVINVPVLIKRGQELHKPEGPLQINRDRVMAIEDIGADSEIITEINRINSLR
ncbi:hypothetical protein HOB10_02450 [Candidatus Parcubacteria bacterium]|jgi:uncharacterized membrane protein YobD (UPF0266 family)|nr:hypothetical protein [Candidatus Parcubacteria bacterium]